MLDQGVVTPSSSPWASPFVLVAEKGVTTRFCVDYRKLNAVTKLEVHPLPRIDDSLDLLAGAQYFSSLDLAAGYWQVGMDKTRINQHRSNILQENTMLFCLHINSLGPNYARNYVYITQYS